jgi:hypothetical protein
MISGVPVAAAPTEIDVTTCGQQRLEALVEEISSVRQNAPAMDAGEATLQPGTRGQRHGQTARA